MKRLPWHVFVRFPSLSRLRNEPHVTEPILRSQESISYWRSCGTRRVTTSTTVTAPYCKPYKPRPHHPLYVPHIYFNIIFTFTSQSQTWRRSCLKHCATSRKVAGSSPDGVTGVFHWLNPSGRTMVLGSTQPLMEMSTRNISWVVNAADAYCRQSYHLHVPTVLKSGSLNLLVASGPL
jgi:hypothetical protein